MLAPLVKGLTRIKVDETPIRLFLLIATVIYHQEEVLIQNPSLKSWTIHDQQYPSGKISKPISVFTVVSVWVLVL